MKLEHKIVGAEAFIDLMGNPHSYMMEKNKLVISGTVYVTREVPADGVLRRIAAICAALTLEECRAHERGEEE